MPVEDANLAVDGSRGAAVAVGVEGDGLDEVLVAVLEIEVEGLLFGAGRVRGGCCGGGGCHDGPYREGWRPLGVMRLDLNFECGAVRGALS